MTKVNFATLAPQFTKEDDNRVLFKTFAEKTAWIDKHFIDAEQDVINITLDTIKTGYIKVRVDDLEKGRNKQYLYMKVGGFTYFYFIDSVLVETADTNNDNYLLRYNLSLDTVTTYLDKVQFKGSTKVKRTHWDRFDNEGRIKFDPTSAVWNNETSVDAKPSIKHNPLPFKFANDTDTKGVEEYFKNFDYNGNQVAVYGIFTGLKGDQRPVYNDKRNVPYVNFIAPMWNPIVSPDTPGIDKTEFTYRGTKFDVANGSATYQIYASQRLQSFKVLNLPLRKHWEIEEAKNFTQFKLDDNSDQLTNGIRAMGADYDLLVKNPLYKKIDKTNIRFDPTNETKLYSSQFTLIALQSYTGERVPLVNEFLLNTDENIKYNFKENIISVEAVAHFTNNSYDKTLANYINTKNDFISRDELPSQSSPYNNYVQDHHNAFKTGVETNRLKGGLGAVAGIAGGVFAGSTGNVMGAMAGIGGGIATAFNAGRQEKMYHAQIDDLKNTPGNNKGISGTILSDWDVIATDNYSESVINYGIIVEELSEIDKYNVAMHFNKYGYETERIMHLASISELERRSRFTYWECSDMDNNIEKGSVPKEVLSELATMFSNGLRLWNPLSEINNYQLENWEL